MSSVRPISDKQRTQPRQERRAGPCSLPQSKVKSNQPMARSSRICKRSKRIPYNLRPKGQQRTRNGRQCQARITGTERRRHYPEEFPDLDFHHSFGSFLTRKNPVSEKVDTRIAQYWQVLSKDPTQLQHHIHDLGNQYREAFRRFFVAEPISLHGHVSDASNPALLTSLITHLVSHASSSCKFPSLDGGTIANPCVAVTEGSYGAGYGPLAYNAVQEYVRPLANGHRPLVIKTSKATRIDAQVKAAKSVGCVALIAEIVSARDGEIVSECVWKHLLKACERHELLLVVDEALTSIRCGAPFAHQLPQYCKHGFPDLVLFGKAIRTNGIAVDWRGINVGKLGIDNDESRMFAVLDWQERLTEMAQAADLLISWGTLVLAERENWPKRAREIGRLLREILASDGVEIAHVSGLHSLIYLRGQDNARFSFPVMGAKAGKYIRWLPVMDTVMTSKAQLQSKVFGAGSERHRKEISAYLRSQDLRLGYCSKCGNPVDADVEGCEVCVVRQCEECEPGYHVCPMAT